MALHLKPQHCNLYLRRLKVTVAKKDFHSKYRSKKDTGARFPLPDIQGELLWGVHPVISALLAERRSVYGAFFKDGVDNERVRTIQRQCSVRNINSMKVTGPVLDSLAGNHPHQGVCLDVSPLNIPNVDIDLISSPLLNTAGSPSIWMLPYRVQDTMNMGAIFRSAFYFGVDSVILPRHYSAGLNSVVSKASAGAMEVMDIQAISNDRQLTTLLQRWREQGGQVVGTTCEEGQGSKVVPVHRYKCVDPTLLIIGNEAKGVSQQLSDMCDVLLYINSCQDNKYLHGHEVVDSLNVSVATGIILHTITRNRI